jgi:P27 family predicted phage terminase small subunit
VKVWGEVRDASPAGLLHTCDRGCFEGYVVLLAARVIAIQMWNSTGNAVMVKSTDGHSRTQTNPYLKEVRRLTEQMRLLESEFGFTPAARSRISMPHGSGLINDPLAKYL